MSNVVNLAERREVVALTKQVEELGQQMKDAGKEMASIRLQMDPALVEYVANTQQIELRDRYRDQWMRLRGPFLEMIEVQLAAQEARGEERNWHLAVAIAFDDRDFAANLTARIAKRIDSFAATHAAYSEQFRKAGKEYGPPPKDPAKQD